MSALAIEIRRAGCVSPRLNIISTRIPKSIHSAVLLPRAGRAAERSYLPLVAHNAGQPQYSLWNEGDDHQNNDCDTNEWGRFTDNRHQGLLGHVRDDEEQQTE